LENLFEYYENEQYLDTLSTLSKKDENDFNPLINSDNELINMDKLSKICTSKSNHSSVDTVEFLHNPNGNFKIYLIEFKNFNLEKQAEYDIINELIRNIREDTFKHKKYVTTLEYLKTHDYLFSSSINIKLKNFYHDYQSFHWKNYDKYIPALAFIKSFFKEEIYSGLKLKPFETFYCIIPELIHIKFADEEIRKKLLNHMYSNCVCEYIFVSNIYTNVENINPSRQRYLKNSFGSLARLKKHSFSDVKLYSPEQFLSFINKIRKSKAFLKRREVRNFVYGVLEKHPIFNMIEKN